MSSRNKNRKSRRQGSPSLDAAAKPAPASGKNTGNGPITLLTPTMPAKVKSGPTALPTFLKTSRPTTAPMLLKDRALANTDITTFRGGVSTRATLRDFAAASPDLAAAVNAYLRTAITDDYTAVARNMDGTFNRDATSLLQQLLTRFDVVKDYTTGFAGTWSIRSISESWAKEMILYGSCTGELVLGKDRLPAKIVPISTTTILFHTDLVDLNPFQRLAGTIVDLDIPTFFYTSLDQDLLEAYSESMLEPAIQPVQFGADFMNDIRRVVKKAIHPRQVVIIDEEKFRANVPSEAQHDPVKLNQYMDTMLTSVEGKINGLAPEDVLVFFDTIGVEYLTSGNNSLDKEYEVLQGIIDSKTATGAKTMPSVLGHGAGTQNVASAETLLFMKNAEGSVQMKLNEMYSRILTLAIRLFGLDCYAEFKYASINLRPKAELEAFKAMEQARVLELLSIGMLDDDEACLILTGNITPDAYVPLTGTFFYGGSSIDPNAVNPYNGQGSAGGGEGGGGPMNQSVKSPAPSGAKGKKPATKPSTKPGKKAGLDDGEDNE